METYMCVLVQKWRFTFVCQWSPSWYCASTADKFVKVTACFCCQDADRSGDKCVVNDVDQSFLGQLAMVNVWKYVLSADEVSKVYHEEFGPGDLLSWGKILEVEKYVSQKTIYINDTWWP